MREETKENLFKTAYVLFVASAITLVGVAKMSGKQRMRQHEMEQNNKIDSLMKVQKASTYNIK